MDKYNILTIIIKICQNRLNPREKYSIDDQNYIETKFFDNSLIFRDSGVWNFEKKYIDDY